MSMIIRTNKGEEIIVDDEDFPLASQYTWHVGSTGYVKTSKKGVSLSLSKLILGKTNRSRTFYRNGNKLDCRKENLDSGTETNRFENGDLIVIHKGESIRVMIDPEDLPAVSMHTWFITDRGYVRCKIRGKNVSLHRFVLGVTERKDKMVVDHKDRDILNCRKSNLRLVSSTQNNFNQKVACDNTSGTKGVRITSDGRSWEAKFQYEGKFKRAYFSIEKYGSETARELALKARKKFESEVHLG